ncbi:MAG: UDP-N-acetylglucosamine 2-epimerase (non-hydrolyzing) [Candidatus Omnitrophica bacterium]|nr:UDP-N-acetylglucosamine 2-epimerase (non-hydrolyzing) [Candidatus Omnitrophota bacterium]
MKNKIAFIFGTRPEIIKLSSLVRECGRRKIPFITIHTGQHYSKSLSDLFIKELELPRPDYNLKIKSKAPYRQGDHTGKMLIELEEILLGEMPSVVVVQGDTNSALAGALVGSKISTTKAFTGYDMKIAHVEAGLRSYDRSMPEEINRVIADHLSNYLFVPTPASAKIAIGEGISKNKVFVTGNTIVDALHFGIKKTGLRKIFLRSLGLVSEKYFLLTLHRQENVDNEKRLRGILEGIHLVYEKFKCEIVFPVHPRTVHSLGQLKIKLPKWLRMIEPCGFLEFLELEKNADLILTDSGGVQEEACVLKVPCVTLRDSTERPETEKAGANIVAGLKPDAILDASVQMLKRKRTWENPFGDGKTAQKILDILQNDAC